MKKTLFVVFLISFITFILVCGIRVYKEVIFNINCMGHLKRAADANTIELAKQELGTVINYLKTKDIVSGYTSILYRTPNEDIGFWYSNLVASLEELGMVSLEASQLEKSNVLMKLRETLLDQGQSISVTSPPGISIFPYNTSYAIIMMLSSILAIVGFVGFMQPDDF